MDIQCYFLICNSHLWGKGSRVTKFFELYQIVFSAMLLIIFYSFTEQEPIMLLKQRQKMETWTILYIETSISFHVVIKQF